MRDGTDCLNHEKLTKRNHYNPCFWSAFWNPDYYRASVQMLRPAKAAREQEVFALNVKSGTIIKTNVNNVHFEKKLGLAEISREAAEAFCRKYQIKQPKDGYPTFLDFEPILSTLEQLQPYQVLLDTIRLQRITSLEQRLHLALFVYLQYFRSHSVMKSSLEWHQTLGIEKFEAFLALTSMITNYESVAEVMLPLMECQWTLFALSDDTFPLSDSPVLISYKDIIVPLSPRLLLEIRRRVRGSDGECQVRRRIKIGKLADFRRRTIGNTFRQLIFGSRQLLERWSASRDFQQRHELMKGVNTYNRFMGQDMWLINEFATAKTLATTRKTST
jgi:hypothetical protein